MQCLTLLVCKKRGGTAIQGAKDTQIDHEKALTGKCRGDIPPQPNKGFDTALSSLSKARSLLQSK